MLALLLVVADILGTWTGESTCTVRPSSCNDEHVVYHVTAGAKPGAAVVQASRIADGKEVDMGTLECTLAGAELTCTIPKGTFKFQIAGDAWTGTLRLTDGTLFRNISLKRAK